MFHIHPEVVPINIPPPTTPDASKGKVLLGKVGIKRFITYKKPRESRPSIKQRTSLLQNAFHTTSLLEETLYDKLIIKGTNPIKQCWDILLELVLAYNIITTCYFLAYTGPNYGLLIIDALCWVLFVIDIPVSILEERFTKKGWPIRIFKKSLKKYLKNWFLVDVISIIPLGFGGHYEIEYYLRMLRLLKLPSVVDLSDGTGLGLILACFHFGKVEDTGKVKYSFKFKLIASLIKLIIFIVFTVYFLGCLWYWFQRKVDNYKYSDDGISFHQLNDLGGTFMDDLEYKEIALSSSYFMLTIISTIGYGDFLAVNAYEMSFIIFIMLFGVILFGYISGSINTTITFLQDMTTGKDFIGQLKTWLDYIEDSQGKLPKLLRKNIIEHFKYYYSMDRLKNLAKCYWKSSDPQDLIKIDDKYLNTLSESSYYEILDQLFPDIWQAFEYYFSNKKFFYALAPHFQPRVFENNDQIYKKGEEMNELYLILAGRVSIGIFDGFVMNDFTSLVPGQVIGDFCNLTKIKNKLDYVSVDRTHTLMVPKEVFLSIIIGSFINIRSHIIGKVGNLHRCLIKAANDIECDKSSRFGRLLQLPTMRDMLHEYNDEAMLESLEYVNGKNSEFKNGLKNSDLAIQEILEFRQKYFAGIRIS